jgi:hypothetical protein
VTDVRSDATPLEVALWVDAVQDAYLVARGRHLALLRGHRESSWLDGLHTYSFLWGRIDVLEGMAGIPPRSCMPWELEEAAREDALSMFVAELHDEGRRDE